jgi:hypothetical protein
MLARVLGAVPHARRFDVAVRMARALAPTLRLAPILVGLRPSKLDTPAATVLSLILNQVHRRAIEFTPRIEVDGDPDVLAGRGRGAVVVGPYSKLNSLLIRYFHEHEPRTVVVTASDDAYQGLGSRATVPHVTISPAFMVTLRRALAADALVSAMIETEPGARRTLEFPTAKGPMHASDALIRLAERCGARLAFASIELTPGGSLRVVLRAPATDQPRTVERDVAAYIGFVQERAAATR